MNTATTLAARLAALTVVFSFVAFLFPVWAQVSVEDPTLDGGETTFEWLGVLSREHDHWSVPESMKPDGSIVFGRSSSEYPHALPYRWHDGEMEALEVFPEWSPFVLTDVSDDGSVIVGAAFIGPGPIGDWVAVRWVDGEAEGLECIEESSGVVRCPDLAANVTADGSTIVGAGSFSLPNGISGRQAFRWTEEEGMVGLPFLPPAEGERAYGKAKLITDDGSEIIGMSESSRGPEVVRWINDEIEVMEGFPVVEEGPAILGSFTPGSDMTPDGSVIVGRYWHYQNERDGLVGEAFRWENGELMGLGDLEGGFFSSHATGVSADGSVVVGSSVTDADDDGHNIVFESFIWTKTEGMRNLKTVLEEDYGIDLNGSILERATAISDDGAVIVGGGYTPDGLYEAWRVVLGKPVADEATPGAPANVLSAPSPNPVRGSALLTLRVAEAQRVNVQVFDAMGRRVQTLYDGALAAGASQPLTLDASALPAGAYIVRTTGEDFTKTRRVTVVQ